MYIKLTITIYISKVIGFIHKMRYDEIYVSYSIRLLFRILLNVIQGGDNSGRSFRLDAKHHRKWPDRGNSCEHKVSKYLLKR